jgi:hypothetical protein
VTKKNWVVATPGWNCNPYSTLFSSDRSCLIYFEILSGGFQRNTKIGTFIGRLGLLLAPTTFAGYQAGLLAFINTSKWILAKINQREEDLIGLLDGMPVLPPGLEK